MILTRLIKDAICFVYKQEIENLRKKYCIEFLEYNNSVFFELSLKENDIGMFLAKKEIFNINDIQIYGFGDLDLSFSKNDCIVNYINYYTFSGINIDVRNAIGRHFIFHSITEILEIYIREKIIELYHDDKCMPTISVSEILTEVEPYKQHFILMLEHAGTKLSIELKNRYKKDCIYYSDIEDILKSLYNRTM